MKFILLLLMLSLNVSAETPCNDDNCEKNMKRYVLVKSQSSAGSVIVGVKTVPEFFQGTVEEYCFELTQTTASEGSVIAFRPKASGKTYSVASLQTGVLSFEPLANGESMSGKQLMEAYKKL